MIRHSVNYRIFSVFLASVLLILSISFKAPSSPAVEAEAATKSELQAEQKEIQQKQADIKKKLSGVRNDESKAQEAYDYICDLIEQNEEEINNLNSQISTLNEDISTAEAAIAQKDREIKQSYEKFKQRLRAMYMAGDMTGGLEVLLCADSFEDMLSATVYLEAIAEYDQALIDTLTQDKDGYVAQKEQIEASKAVLETKKAEISEKKSENDALAAEAKEKLASIQKKEAELVALQKQYDKEMEANQAALDSIISSLTGESTGKFNGSFIWPTPSCYRISSPYGMRWGRLHKGIDIPASYGSKIVAAASGKVTKKGWDASGYGNYVIIDHGGGYMTVYAHMSSVSVKQGATISQGQQVGKIGSTGRSTGPHLHFEIRVNGTAKNPMNFF